MLDYFRTIKDAFYWQKKLGLKPLVMFILNNVFAYIFLVGLYLVVFRMLVYTPLVDYVTVDIISEITANVLNTLQIILCVPVILHVIKTTFRGITEALH
ncbi:Uncharacterised protein [Cedecea lapagei]|uniref:Uncharacterized protein n=1 Tax=Cedecea lapagei TaxID=158823 RepID=A0A3S4J3R5_9ENTR|nr:Uncharacterised protein [Cedecea lapagei]